MDATLSIAVIAVSGLIELTLCFFIRRPRKRFILPIMLLVSSVSLFLYGRFAPLEGLKDLAYMVSGILIFFACAASSAVAVIYNLIAGKRKRL